MIYLAPHIEMENASGKVKKRGVDFGHIAYIDDHEIRAAWERWLSA